MARQAIDWNAIDPNDLWLYAELDDLYAELDKAGIEDATEWEHFGAIESILYTLAERAVWRENYPMEQYEADRKRMISEGVDPRCIMSYSECMAYDLFKAEEEAYDEWEREESRAAEVESEPLSEFDAYGVEERDELLALVEQAYEVASSELAAFGFSESPFDTEDFEDWYEWDYSEEYFEAWHEACRDIFEVTGEFAMDEVYGLVD